jgi:hypothetical protein
MSDPMVLVNRLPLLRARTVILGWLLRHRSTAPNAMMSCLDVPSKPGRTLYHVISEIISLTE